MSDAQLRHVVAGLCKGIGTLERRVHELEKANEFMTFPVGRVSVSLTARAENAAVLYAIAVSEA